MAKKKFRKTYRYKCSITNQVFTRTAEAAHPEDLLSINAYYDMHPELDDRPEKMKILAKVAFDEAMAVDTTSLETDAEETTN